MAHPSSTAFKVTTLWDGILFNTLQASSMWPQRHQNPIQFEWSAHECTSPPKPACAFIITWTKVNLSAFIPSCCICWKNCVIAFSCCSSFIYLMQKCSIAWCLVPLEPSQVSSIPKPEWFPCLRFCARAEESKFKVLQGLTSHCHLIVGLLICTGKMSHEGDTLHIQKVATQSSVLAARCAYNHPLKFMTAWLRNWIWTNT